MSRRKSRSKKPLKATIGGSATILGVGAAVALAPSAAWACPTQSSTHVHHPTVQLASDTRGGTSGEARAGANAASRSATRSVHSDERRHSSATIDISNHAGLKLGTTGPVHQSIRQVTPSVTVGRNVTGSAIEDTSEAAPSQAHEQEQADSASVPAPVSSEESHESSQAQAHEAEGAGTETAGTETAGSNAVGSESGSSRPEGKALAGVLVSGGTVQVTSSGGNITLSVSRPGAATTQTFSLPGRQLNGTGEGFGALRGTIESMLGGHLTSGLGSSRNFVITEILRAIQTGGTVNISVQNGALTVSVPSSGTTITVPVTSTGPTGSPNEESQGSTTSVTLPGTALAVPTLRPGTPAVGASLSSRAGVPAVATASRVALGASVSQTGAGLQARGGVQAGASSESLPAERAGLVPFREAAAAGSASHAQGSSLAFTGAYSALLAAIAAALAALGGLVTVASHRFRRPEGSHPMQG